MPSQTTFLSPFRSIRYDGRGAGSHPAAPRDLSPIITPPYDIISPALQEALYARHPHNFIRIELPRDSASDTEQDNRYTRAAHTLRAWLSEGVLVREEEPCFYVLEQEFRLGQRTWHRRGVFALVRLPEPGERRVLAHEGTLAGPKADRLHLMRACQAMSSPIMAICEDLDSSLLRLLRAGSDEPDATATDDEGVQHRLWAVADRALVKAISAAMGAGPLFIADGHHRFDTAMAYRDEMRQSPQGAPEGAGCNYALMLITSARDEAVKILPTHRLLSGLGSAALAKAKACMDSRHFDVQIVRLDDPDDLPDGLWLDEPVAGNERPPVCAIYFGDGNYYLLTPTAELAASWRSAADEIPVNIVHDCLLDAVLSGCRAGVPTPAVSAATGPQLTYTTDGRSAIAAVSRRGGEFAILLRPTLLQHVLEMARAGERMPGKSTYFYPKVPAGLVVSDASAASV
jgi:uncharacterized protein (DUF1015 family)